MIMDSVKRAIGVALLTTAIGACGYMPDHNTTRVDTPSSLSVTAAPANAQVFLNGSLVGVVNEDGEMTRTNIADGTHQLRIESAGVEILSKQILVQDGSHRRIVVN